MLSGDDFLIFNDDRPSTVEIIIDLGDATIETEPVFALGDGTGDAGAVELVVSSDSK